MLQATVSIEQYGSQATRKVSNGVVDIDRDDQSFDSRPNEIGRGHDVVRRLQVRVIAEGKLISRHETTDAIVMIGTLLTSPDADGTTLGGGRLRGVW
jgi:hypothetical protein